MVTLSSGICKARDFRVLAQTGQFTDEMVNAVPAQGDFSDVHAFQLPSFLYVEIELGKFKSLDKWLENIVSDRDEWVFGVHQPNHWMVVVIDWSSKTIQLYDPMRKTLSKDGRRILGVSPLRDRDVSETKSESSTLKPGRNPSGRTNDHGDISHGESISARITDLGESRHCKVHCRLLVMFKIAADMQFG